ncbi:rRNA maturation RNase YbeY [Candidatus Wolfebacteria bacterium CG1_02_39_135]|uniref:Endoribonuclease YbeY n=1 Tax=Candidatus Wolfebacteria bacterium CG1_02_39_135 TaxID=1805425 RepID=A0A1J4XT57_9BACT|nr:rRNA maturation RNase YbeY [Candidatus Wolfebacteria bacterium]NCQ02740.1 rRNA maturation RNase YbeY [Candidatus Wolfebacteria bacterium]OIO64956.1 MAG: rRNA maturation RNase YbeY [Candidatus Wolfebacteria bacterium CG1_02_39_135]
MNKVSVTSLDKKCKKFEKKIKFAALKILKILKKTNVLVEIYLINNQKMRFLNKKFRGKNKTTTILSFEESRNFILPPSKYKKIGEIYLNEETRDKKQETRLLVHGLLHLFGYNHQEKNDRIRMEKAEQKLLLKIRSTKHEIRNNI